MYNELYHHGIMGQRWGVRNGPPYPLSGGSYIKTKRKNYKPRHVRNSIYNKKHFDQVLKKDKTTLTTLSYDKNRTKNVDMFYAAHTTMDKHQYNALFNKKISTINGTTYKFKINNNITNDVKVASEDSASKVFLDLYSNNRDFFNFITDESRMLGHIANDRYKFKGYREAKNTLNKLKRDGYVPTDNDIKTIYRLFNYVIPSEGTNNRESTDVLHQRTKFFEKLKDAGYSAVLDTNDAIYGGFKTTSPVIIFDMEKIVLDSIGNTTLTDKKFSELMYLGRKILGM